MAAFYLPDQDLAVTLSFHDAVPEQHLGDLAVITVVRPPRKSGQSMSIVKEALDVPVSLHSFNGRQEMVTDRPIDVGSLRLAMLIRRESFINIGHNPAVPFYLHIICADSARLGQRSLLSVQQDVAVCDACGRFAHGKHDSDARLGREDEARLQATI